MKRVFVVLALAAIGIAYFAGYWPQRQYRVASEKALDSTRASLERAEARNRLYGLQSQLIDLLGTVEARNFGDAQGKATAFFDGVRAEAGRPDQRHARETLEGIVAERDSLTVALTTNDTAAVEMIRGIMTRLRQALDDTPAQADTETSPPLEVPSPK